MKDIVEYIKYYDDVLDESVCEELITRFEQYKDNQTHTTGRWKEDYRSFHELDITTVHEFKDLVKPIYQAANAVYNLYNSQVGTFLPIEFGYENLRLKRYDANNHDQFGWHTDVGNYASARRYLVLFFYLNDVEYGGETQFEFDRHYQSMSYCTIKPKRGRIAVFPPMWMFPHRGCKPISGPKYILSTYAHYQ